MCYVTVLCVKLITENLQKLAFKYWAINYSLDTTRALNPDLLATMV